MGSVLARIGPTVRETVRMGFLRSSRRVGRPLKELAAVWDIRYSGQSKGPGGATRLHFGAQTLGQAAPKLFRQGLLFDDLLNPDQTAFDLVGSMLCDLSNQEKESDRFDTDLLKNVAKYERTFRHGVATIQFGGHAIRPQASAIDSKLVETARSLFEQTPRPQRVRVSGVLDMLRISDHVLELILPDNQRVRVLWVEKTVVALKEYLNQRVLIEGDAIFRPSGRLLRVDASVITAAKPQDDLFSTVPQSHAAPIQRSDYLKPATAKTGFAAIYGQWPGDETEEELLAALKEMRR